jgi:Rod binding domain-containing protein
MSLSLSSLKMPITEATNTAKSATAQVNDKSAKQLRQNLALKKAAQEFESQLLSALWKSMQGSLNSQDDSGDPAAGNIQDLQVQALCSGMANSGGIGIAKMIIGHLDSPGKAKVSSQPEQNQGISLKGH